MVDRHAHSDIRQRRAIQRLAVGGTEDTNPIYLLDAAATGGDAIQVAGRTIHLDPQKPALSTNPVRTDEIAFEDIGAGVRKATLGSIADLALPASIGAAPDSATYVVMSANAALSGERVLTQGSAITVTDGGAGGPATVDFDPDGPASATPARTDETAFQDVGVGVRKAQLGTIADLALPANIGAAPADAAFLTIGNDARLSAERRLIANVPLTIADGGANAAATIDLNLGDGVTVVGGLLFVLLDSDGGLVFTGTSEVRVDPSSAAAAAAIDFDADTVLIDDDSASDVKKASLNAISPVEVLQVNTANATAITATSETDLSITLTIPANTLAVGDLLITRWAGIYSTGGFGGAGSLQWRLRANDGTTNVLLLNFESQTYGVSATNQPFSVEACSVVRAIGASGSIITTPWTHQFGLNASTIDVVVLPAAGATTVAVDTTVANTWKVSAQWADSGDTVTVQHLTVFKYKGR